MRLFARIKKFTHHTRTIRTIDTEHIHRAMFSPPAEIISSSIRPVILGRFHLPLSESTSPECR